MAEPATAVAGLWAAEEVVSTGVQAGLAGYAVSKPTMPIKAEFTQIAASTDDSSRASLTRSHHSVSVVKDKAYIFGGETLGGKRASNEMHAIALSADATPDYKAIPALAANPNGAVPTLRTKHAACSLNNQIAVFGGCDEHGIPVDVAPRIWLFDTEKSTWDVLEPAIHIERSPPQRSEAKLFAHDGNLVLYGGRSAKGEVLNDVWYFSCFTKTWNALPTASVSTSCAALSGDTLYLISSDDDLGSELHHLEIKLYAPADSVPVWESIKFPTNPLTKGPGPRTGAGLLPVSTGYGRNYLLYFFGDRVVNSGAASAGPAQWGDMWTFQLPSDEPEMKPAFNLAEAIKPAKIKDQIRAQFGADTGKSVWEEVEVAPPSPSADAGASAGETEKHPGAGEKLLPGPRSRFGCDVIGEDRSKVLMWGGVDASGKPGEAIGDGWIIKFG